MKSLLNVNCGSCCEYPTMGMNRREISFFMPANLTTKLKLIVTYFPLKKNSLRKYITICRHRLAIKVENLVAKQSVSELKHRYFVSR